MTPPSPASPPPISSTPPSAALDWSLVPFEVGCARCGHDLRGAAEPVCAACGLTFDWVDAVPIERLTCSKCGYRLYGLTETRCTECGTNFTWEEALRAYHERNKPLFEYQWRTRPVRSLLRTWWLALRPKRLWSMLTIHDEPRAGPLLAVLGIALSTLVITNAMLDAVIEWLWSINSGRSWPGFSEHTLQLFGLFGNALRSGSAYGVPGRALLWIVITFGTLMIFQQSMRACRVRTIQVLRVLAYGLPFAPPIAVFLAAVMHYVGASVDYHCTGRFDFGIVREIGVVLATSAIVLVIPFSVWSLRQGYRMYLRMPHAFGVAVASQIIAWLATAVLIVVPGVMRGWW